MLIPIRTDYRMRRRPWVNYLLVAANVLIFLAGFNGLSTSSHARIANWMLHPDAPQVGQFFTSVFLHADWLHLGGNMVFLWVFGNAINDRFGHLGYLAFYLAGGVLAGVGYCLVSQQAPVLGASGAIAAVTGAYLVLLPRSRVTVIAWLFFMILPLEIPSLYFVLFQFLFNLYLTAANSGGNVAVWAHNAGYVFGIGVAAALLATKVLPRDAFDLLSLIRARRRRHEYHRVVSGGYDPFGRRYGGGPDPGARRVSSYSVGPATRPPIPTAEMELRSRIADSLARHDVASAAEIYLQLLSLVPAPPPLPLQQQLDVANQLMATERYVQAAGAYELFIRSYGDYTHMSDIYLMLGIVYGRYLRQYEQARQYLQRAIDRLHDPRKIALAQADLDAIRTNGALP